MTVAAILPGSLSHLQMKLNRRYLLLEMVWLPVAQKIGRMIISAVRKMGNGAATEEAKCALAIYGRFATGMVEIYLIKRGEVCFRDIWEVCCREGREKCCREPGNRSVRREAKLVKPLEGSNVEALVTVENVQIKKIK